MGNENSQENVEEEEVAVEEEFDWSEGPQVENSRMAAIWLIETKSKIDSYEAERSRSIKTPDATTTGGATSEIDRKSILTLTIVL